MKKFKYLLSTAIAMLMLLSGSVFATENQWKNVFTKDFNGASGSASNLITEAKSLVSAEYENDALVVKSDTLFSYTVEDHTDYQGTKNAHGIKLNYLSDRIITTPLETPVVAYGHTYNYSSKGDNAICMVSEIAGKKAIKQATYINEDRFDLNAYYADPDTYTVDKSQGLRTNYSRFAVADKNLFDINHKDYIVEIEYYTEDAEDNKMTLNYANGSDWGTATTVYDCDPATAAPSPVTGAWTTAEIALTDADFSKMMEGSGGTGKVSFRIETSSNKVNYIHSVKIKKNKKEYNALSGVNSTVSKVISDEPIYGNARVTFDLTVPADDFYNKGTNIMSTGLVDGYGVEFATALYEISGADANVYVLSAGSKEAVASIADFVGKTLKYEVITDMKGGMYSFRILDGETELGAVTDVLANGSGDGYFKLNAINLKHNAESDAVMSVIDNIKVDMQEDINYVKSKEDMDAIELNIFNNTTASNFELPQTGTVNGSTITWAENHPNIEIVGNTAVVTRDEENDVSGTLISTVEYDGFSQTREFTVTVKSLKGAKVAIGTLQTSPDGVGTVSASIVVENARTSGLSNINLIVTSVNPATGDITGLVDTQPVPEDDYAPLSLSVSGLPHTSGNEIKYYLWGDNNISLINNAPSPVKNIEVVNKVSGIQLKWDAVKDDNDAVSYYEINRNGVKIDEFVPADTTAATVTYTDKSCERFTDYTYTIVPVDTNDLKDVSPEVIEQVAGKTVAMPYTLTPLGTKDSEINSKANSNGITMRYEDSIQRGIYTEDATVVDADGVTVRCRKVPSDAATDAVRDTLRGMGVLLKDVNKSSGVAIEVTYLDRVGTIFYQYGIGKSPNYVQVSDFIVMENTNTWKVATIIINDPIETSSIISNSDFIFGIQQGSDANLYIKRVEAVTLDLYQ